MKSALPPRWSRSLLPLLLLPLAAVVDRPAGDRQDGAPDDPAALSAGGTSIFHETMVDMPWTAVEAAARAGALVLLPVGVVEEHGPHLGCGIDTYGAYLTCKLVRRELEARGVPAVIAPPIYWGVNSATHVFPGTFTARPETMTALLQDVLTSLQGFGFETVLAVNHHGDGLHCATLLRSLVQARQELGIDARQVLSGEQLARFRLTGEEPFVLACAAAPDPEEEPETLDIHAGAYETGLAAALLPDQTDVELARTLEPTDLTMADVRAWLEDARATTPGGYFGDPASFDAARSLAELRAECVRIADAIEERYGGD